MLKKILIKASILGGVAVIGGAFGAHALKEVLNAEQLLSFQTGVRYQLIHAVVLLFLALLLENRVINHFKTATHFLFWGIILFSGSIYVLTLKNIIGVAFLKIAGPITPIGGTLIIIGWFFILLGAFKITNK
jgi:uncharacterized membrane protein YgdD (TMEM256/DUF423 family)